MREVPVASKIVKPSSGKVVIGDVGQPHRDVMGDLREYNSSRRRWRSTKGPCKKEVNFRVTGNKETLQT